jgi:hypothetical protein
VSFLREESNLHPFSKRRGYASQHCQRMSLIIGIFQATDHRSGGAHQFHQWPLGEASFGAKLMYAVSQVVGFRPRQVMSQVLEAFQASHVLGLSLRGKMIKPLIGWRCAVIFPVKYHFH